MRLASQVPPPQVLSSALWLSDFDKTSNLPQAWAARTVSSGDLVWSNNFNRNAALADLAAAFGGAGIGIAQGLDITPGSGLNAWLGEGTAVAGSVVQIPTPTQISLSANSQTYVWLTWSGSVLLFSNPGVPAQQPSVYLGLVVTGASSVTEVDSAGVVRLFCGIPQRQVGGYGPPDDFPPGAWRGFTVNEAGQAYWWNGTTYEAPSGVEPSLFEVGFWKVVDSSSVSNLTGTKSFKGKLTVYPGGIVRFM